MRNIILVSISIGAVVIVLFVIVAGISANEEQRIARLKMNIMDDIVEGKTISGTLEARDPQFLCFNAMDTLKNSDAGVDPRIPGAEEAVVDQLFKQGRCTYSGRGAHFDMTADGRERFTTPSGSVELWAAR